MIKIKGYTVKELNRLYNIPIGTIYRWNQNDPAGVFDKIRKRKARKRQVSDKKRAYKFVAVGITILICLFIFSCSSTIERFELPPKEDYTYYETSDPNAFIQMTVEKVKNNSLIYDPSICTKNKSTLPRKEHILEDMNELKADSVIVVNLNNSNGQLTQVNGKWEFGYKSGYYCKSAAFFKKNESK